MAYYLQGDYYQGDPFLGGLIKGIGKVAVGAATGFLGGGPVGAITGGIRAVTGAMTTTRVTAPTIRTPTGTMPRITRAVTGTGTQTATQPVVFDPKTGKTSVRKKYRRMNVTNDKALRRAVRRQAGFVKLAKKALQGTGYTVVSRSSRARKVNVRESGAGSVTIH